MPSVVKSLPVKGIKLVRERERERERDSLYAKQ